MRHHQQNDVVHLELHTHDPAEVRAYLWQLLSWRSWLPYVQVGDVRRATERAGRELVIVTIYVPALVVSSALIPWQLPRSPLPQTRAMLAGQH